MYPKEKRKQNIPWEYPFDVDFHQFDWVLMISDTQGVPVPPQREMYNCIQQSARKKVPFFWHYWQGNIRVRFPRAGKKVKMWLFFWKLEALLRPNGLIFFNFSQLLFFWFKQFSPLIPPIGEELDSLKKMNHPW